MNKPTAELAPLAPPPGLPSGDRAPQKVPVTIGVAPKTIEEAWRLAVMISKSDEMIPKPYRDQPEKILVAIQMGIEIGFAPMQALQSIAVIGGRPGVWGDGLLALVISAPVYQDHDEWYEVEVTRQVQVGDKVITEKAMERRDGLTGPDLDLDTSAAVSTFVRRHKATPVTRRFTVGQARKAGYLGPKGVKGGGKEGPWQTHPDRMLQMRARSFAARDAFPDVLRGIRTAEELRDLPPDAEIEALAPPRLVHRLSEQPLDARAHVGAGEDAAREAGAVPQTSDDRGTPPLPVEEVIGPSGIKEVANLIGGPCAYLDNGAQVWLSSEEDAADLTKCIGTSHRLLFTVVPVEDAPQQRRAIRFAIAE